MRVVADADGIMPFEAVILDLAVGGIAFMVYGSGITLEPGTVLRGCRIAMPGGGGLGNPRKRPAAVVAQDVRQGFISAEAARRDYGVAVNDDGTVDEAETAKLRALAAE